MSWFAALNPFPSKPDAAAALVEAKNKKDAIVKKCEADIETATDVETAAKKADDAKNVVAKDQVTSNEPIKTTTAEKKIGGGKSNKKKFSKKYRGGKRKRRASKKTTFTK